MKFGIRDARCGIRDTGCGMRDAGCGMRQIKVGAWREDRSGPMQVVSGPIGRERVHFEAPVAETLNREMQVFLDWFDESTKTDWVAKAGLAHLWFVTIHPLDRKSVV